MVLLLSIIVVVITNIFLGVFVYINNPKKIPNRAFALMCLGLSLWAFFNYLADYQLSNTLLWTRLTFFAISYSFGFLLIFLNNFPKRVIDYKYFNYIAIFTSTVVGILTFSSNFIKGIKIESQTSNVETGSLYIVFLIYFLAFFLFFIYLLIRGWRMNRGIDHSRYSYLMIGIVSMAVLASITNLVLPLITGQNEYAKYGTLFTLIFVGFTSYAMVKHSLFDIRSAAVRYLTYILSMGTIGVVYGFTAYRFATIFINNLSPTQQQAFYVVLTVIVAFTFAPLRRFFEKITNKIFYRDHYEPEDLINEIGRVLASEIDLNKINSKVINLITSKIKIDETELVIFGHKQLFYENNVFKNNNDRISLKELSKLGRAVVIRDNLLAGTRKEILLKYGISAAFALHTSEKFIGYLLLGNKKSGDIYSDVDIKTLKIISNEVSIAIANALSYKEIQMFNTTLADRVRQRTNQLKNANAQLKDLDRAKDEFISMASHQLRTPLTTVKGYISMLDDGDFGRLTKEQKEKIEIALNGSNRMARLIDDLLNVSRMDANRFFLDIADVDLNIVIEEELAQLQSWSKQDNLKLSYSGPKNKIPTIRLDENKTRQVVMNLIDNAMHYSKPTGGWVKVSLDIKGGYAVFKVEDNGIGVPTAAQPKLFTKMFRAENAKNVRPDGTGLGLYLVRRIVEEQGGEIIFESHENKGSIFGFRLPISGVPKSVEEVNAKIGKKVLSRPRYS